MFFIVLFFLWLASRWARPFVPFVATVRPFSPPLSKVPLNNLDYHANSVNTRLLFFCAAVSRRFTYWQMTAGFVYSGGKSKCANTSLWKDSSGRKSHALEMFLKLCTSSGKAWTFLFSYNRSSCVWLQLHRITFPIPRLEWKTTYWNLFHRLWNQWTFCSN